MSPKIQVLPDGAQVKSESKIQQERKNPFATKKKTTVRRDPKDVYPDKQIRKGLNEPQFLGNTPLDKLFQNLEELLKGDIDEIGLEVLDHRLFPDVSAATEFESRFRVVERLLNYLIEIQTLSNDAQPVNDDKNLIKISLHDIRTFGKLVNLVIIHGIYPALNTFKLGIPFEKRRLNEFSKSKKQLKIAKINDVPGAKSYKDKFSNCERMLQLIYDKLSHLFAEKSDVQELLVKGTGYSDFLTVAAALITVPYFGNTPDKSRLLAEFNNFVTHLPDTYELFQTYSLLLTTPSPPFFKQFIMSKLQTLHYNAPRKDGIASLCEFVLGLRDNDEVNIEKFEHVSNVILSKPKSISTIDYFKSIGRQIYDELVKIDKLIITSCLTFVVDKLWQKNSLVARDFIFKCIWENFNPVDNPGTEILVSEASLNNNINVLISISKSSTSPELLATIFRPIILPIWSYFVFLKSHSKSTDVIQNILVSYFTVTHNTTEIQGFTSLDDIDTISKNLLIEGNDYWEYAFGANGLLQIERSQVHIEADGNKMNNFLDKLDSCCTFFVELLKDLDDDLVQGLFARILKRWLGVEEKKLDLEFDLTHENAFFVLVDLRLLEQMGNEFKEILARTPVEMLEIVKDFLLLKKKELTSTRGPETLMHVVEDSDDGDSDDEDSEDELSSNILPIVLELLSVILSEVVELDTKSLSLLSRIQGLLSDLSKSPTEQQNITNALNSLHDRIQILLEGDTKPTSTSDLHAKILKRAITSLNDPLVPIRAHGLYLLRQLIELQSPQIAIEFVVKLHLIQLKDPEPYIYLNVIKGLESLLNMGGDEVVDTLLAIYLNNNGDADLDDRLKIGEVFIRYIQIQNELFTGELATKVVDATLAVIRRVNDDDGREQQDDRLRMSAMSLLGVCCHTPIGILSKLEDALDCAIMILQLETGKDKAIMRRAAIVLIHDLIVGTCCSSTRVDFPHEYQTKVVTVLTYIVDTDNDLLVRDQATTVLDTIDDIIKQSVKSE